MQYLLLQELFSIQDHMGGILQSLLLWLFVLSITIITNAKGMVNRM